MAELQDIIDFKMGDIKKKSLFAPKVNQVIVWQSWANLLNWKKVWWKFFSWKALTSISLLGAIVIKGLMIWGSKCHQNNFPVECDGYVKYEEAEVDRLVAILQTNNCGGGGGPCGIQ